MVEAAFGSGRREVEATSGFGRREAEEMTDDGGGARVQVAAAANGGRTS